MSRLDPILEGLTEEERAQLHGLQDGYQFERAVTGRSAEDRRRGVNHRVGFWRAFDEVRAHRPDGWDPRNPNRPKVKRLRWLVARCFSAKEWRRITIFPTVGTSLDFYHGADLVISWGPVAVVTIDLSLKNKSAEQRLADILIQPEDFEREDGQDRRLQKIAKEIARLLQQKNRINVIGR